MSDVPKMYVCYCECHNPMGWHWYEGQVRPKNFKPCEECILVLHMSDAPREPTEVELAEAREWRRANFPGIRDEPPFIDGYETADQVRRMALEEQRLHDPADQGHGYDRCEHCHYTRHPCSVYELATIVLALIDRGRTGEWESEAT